MAIPMRVLTVTEDGTRALCAGRGRQEELDALLTGPLEPGQWVLSFLGSAREVVTAEEAAQVDEALDALERALSGAPLDLR